MAQSVTEIKTILATAGLSPRHRFGQNFLIDPRKLKQIIDASELKPGDVVLEVGPGTGVLTEELLAAGARVVAVEIDRDLAALLRRRLGADSDRFILINDDALASKHELNPAIGEALGKFSVPSSAIRVPSFKLIANLPYNIASPLLAILSADWPAMTAAIVMVQREVADRLTAAPGNKDYGPISVLLQALCELSIITLLSPGCFWPQPQIDSAVVKITRRDQPLTSDPARLSAIVHKLFSHRRKQIGSVLGRSTPLPPGIDPASRPEQLTIQQWIELANSPAIP